MKVISWNVNSVPTRLPRIVALLARHSPDLLCLQELKVGREAFPTDELAACGYWPAVHAQRARNGVALLARQPLTEVTCGFTGDPVPEQARTVSAMADGLRVVTAYVVNGQAVGTGEYALKLRWLEAFSAWLRAAHRPSDALLVVGDFNVAPEDRDVHDPESWRGRNSCSEPERRQIRSLLDWGMVDLARLHYPRARALHVLGLPARRLPPRLGAAHRPRPGHLARSHAMPRGRRRPRRTETHLW
ncbi:exodeoxyribonuclease III [Saccharopolyspora hattusasensis]|uniref:exodeoxyribonuclease III n=1 Tax=Saccharopolyspora hattusasensis TaxID=1128679 RepID=UPI003D96CF7E